MVVDSRSIVENLKEAILVLDKDGYITYANPAAGNLLGYRSEELTRKNIAVVYSEPDDATRPEYELSVARKKGEFNSLGWKRKQSGLTFWGEMTFTPYYDQHTLSGYLAVIRDTTARKEAELTLRGSEERFRLMVEGIQDYSILLLDINGYVVTWNEGAHRMTGYSENEMIGQHFSLLFPEPERKSNKAEEELNLAITNNKFEVEGWRVKKNGSMFWAYTVITPLYNSQNKLIGFSKVTKDLSEKRKSEEMLRLSEERYRLLVEQVTDYGIFMLDEKGRIISWNEGARKIKGYEAEEIVGKYFSIFYPEEDIISGKPAHELKVAINEGKYEEEGWRIRKDGSRFWANIVITTVYNSQGTHIGFSKVTKDLTERKLSEKALRESYERYRHLAGQLKQTNEELSFANEELEQFTSIVSHDLQEPVRTIKSFLQLIDIKVDELQLEELKKYISKSIDAANRMKELIRNLLHYSQLGKGELEEEEVNATDLINQAIQNLKSSIDTCNAVITVENSLGNVYGDRIQLVQLIQNLLHNALKFTNSTNPKIAIKCAYQQGHPIFSISDNGIGIAEHDLSKVFEIFRRLNTKQVYPGTGIGLAICKKIVDRHSGRIWPESTPGKGTTFYFTLNEEPRQSLTAS